MGFLSVLKKVGHGLQVGVAIADKAAPFAGLIPGFGGTFITVLNVIHSMETAVGDGNGPAKKAAAMGILTALLPGMKPEVLSQVIDALVSSLNAVAAAQAKTVVVEPSGPGAVVFEAVGT
jgi:hypothetical protein